MNKVFMRGKKGVASIQIFLIVLSVFSFAFLLFESEVVSGQGFEAAIATSLGGGGVPLASQPVITAATEAVSAVYAAGGTAVEAAAAANSAVASAGGISAAGDAAAAATLKAGAPAAVPGIGSALLSAVGWAALAYGVGLLVGSLFGLSDAATDSLALSLAGGTLAGSFVGGSNTLLGTNFLGANSLGALGATGVGVIVAVVIFIATYKDQKQKTVKFSCLPWQAPVTGYDCEVCNDPDLPCSEYKCRSLGQNCELVNEGTSQESCVNVNPNDVSPPIIRPNNADLTTGHEYRDVRNSPPGPGFTIYNLGSDDGCLQAYTPLEFGIETDEPSQCRVDFVSTTSFEEMRAFMGGINLFTYNHSEQFVLPGGEVLENSSFILENGKDITFFMRCRDKNGNENSAEYAVNFCIDPSPDTTAPRIDATSIQNGACVAENQNDALVEFYTNEPADCRWSVDDQSYDSMSEDNQMDCSNELYQINANQLFTCQANLQGIAKEETSFYVRCRDQPGAALEDRNTMSESLEFSLRGSDGLRILTVQPNETIFGGVSPSPVELYAQTKFGCNEDRAICYYSETGDIGDYIQFFDTNTEDGIHTQKLSLLEGSHEYFVQCVDAGGNVAEENIEFNLDIDENAPVVARVYEDGSKLKVVTVRDSECSYTLNSCDFAFNEGIQMPIANSTVHFTEWNKENTYYIKCRDEFRNEEAACSVIVKPSQFFL